MKVISACMCAGAAAWCSLGTVGLIGQGSTAVRLALLPPWWLLPVLIAVAFAAVRIARLTTPQLLPLYTSALAILPWLPVPLPAAALLWTGPFVAAVWCAVVVGLIVTSRRPVRSRWVMDPPRARLLAAALALALYGASAWWLSPIPPNGDAPHYLIITQSLVRDGDLQIENNHQRGDYLEYYPGALKPDYLRRGTNDAIYSIHAPGLPALIAPAYFLFGLPGAVALLALIGAIGTALVWHLGHRLTGSASAAWFGWACCALTTPFFFVVTQIFPDAVAATCTLLGMLPLIDPDAERRSTRMWLLSGTSLAILPWLQTRLAVIAAAVAICLVFRIRRVNQFASFAAPAAVSAALWFGFFYTTYGTFNPTAPYGNYTQTSVTNFVRSGPGLLFDQQFGLIPSAPVYGLILVGVIAAAARRRRWSWELLIVMVPYMTTVGLFGIWWGGTSSPARLMTPLSLLLGVAAARIWHDARMPVTKAMGLAALGASVLASMVLLLPDRGQLLFNFRDGVALSLEWANDLIDLPRGVPSVFRDSPEHAWLKIAAWGASFAAAWLALQAIDAKAGRASTESKRLSILAAATPSCLAVAVMVALSLSWRLDGIQPLTPDTAQLSLLGHASEFRTFAYDYGARRFEPSDVALENVRLRSSGRRTMPRPAPLLSLAHLPAGTYRVNLVAPGEADGTLLMRVGATSLPLWTWSLGSVRAGPVETPIRFPVDVRSFVIEGDDQARRTITALELVPVLQEPLASREPHATLLGRGAATHAARYGLAETFFLDDHAFAEPGGFWVAGGQDARVVVTNHASPLQLFLRNAPVANTVVIELDGERREIVLGPGEETTIVLPGKKGARDATVRLQTRSGFRPWQTDHANADMRYLGCWVEIR